MKLSITNGRTRFMTKAAPGSTPVWMEAFQFEAGSKCVRPPPSPLWITSVAPSTSLCCRHARLLSQSRLSFRVCPVLLPTTHPALTLYQNQHRQDFREVQTHSA